MSAQWMLLTRVVISEQIIITAAILRTGPVWIGKTFSGWEREKHADECLNSSDS